MYFKLYVNDNPQTSRCFFVINAEAVTCSVTIRSFTGEQV